MLFFYDDAAASININQNQVNIFLKLPLPFFSQSLPEKVFWEMLNSLIPLL